MMKKAIVLLSGGMDSATVLYHAKARGYKCHCLIFNYGQKSAGEVEAAKRVARKARCQFEVVNIRLPWGGSALLDKAAKIPGRTRVKPARIPSTYVPARNTIFLSFALSFAEAQKAEAVFIGAHTQDYSGYPDCRPLYFKAFRKIARLGTKAGVSGKKIKILAPLLRRKKSAIIKIGLRLGVPYELTRSCYNSGQRPCGRCESCLYRAKGFTEAGVRDPACAYNR